MTRAKRCMVCGKPAEDGSTICRPCNESIRGEATGQRKKIFKEAQKEAKHHGNVLPELKPKRSDKEK